MSDGEFPRNHNQVALPLDEQAKIAIDEALVTPRRRWRELEDSFGKAAAEIADTHVAQQVTTLIAQIGALLKAVDLAHETAKAPWLEASRTIDGVANGLREPARNAKKALEARLTAFQAAEQKRIEAERAAERAAYDEDPEPAWQDRAAQDRQHVTIRSDQGASAHLADDIEVEIVDVKKIPKRYLERPRVLAALKAELKPDLKKGDTIAGAKSIEKKKTRVRRG